jgi:hypothetical protein
MYLAIGYRTRYRNRYLHRYIQIHRMGGLLVIKGRLM